MSGFFDEDKSAPEQVLTTLKTRWSGPRTCPVCQNENWRVQAQFILEGEHGIREDGWETYLSLRLVPVMCNSCGYTFFINPDLGVFPVVVEPVNGDGTDDGRH